MASTRKQTTKDGRDFYEIRCRVSREKSELTTRWYVPGGWSQKAIDRELAKQAADFERRCAAGEVLSRADIKAQKAAEEKAAAAILTVKQYGERVFMPAKAVTCSENTRSSFQSMLDHHVYPALGSEKMPEVSSAQISAMLLDFQKNHAHASCVKLYTIVSLLFKMAYMGDMIDRNPMDKVERPKPRKDEAKVTEVESYTAEELRYILACLDNEPLKWRALMHLLIDTGIRRGEVCGLQWKNVDFTENTITIAQTLNYTKDKGVYLDTPKNGKLRTVDVAPSVMALLKEVRAEQAKSGISAFVFTQDGSYEPMHPQSPERYMQNFSKRYDVEHLHPHKLRHSFASVAITSGADVASISEILGHSDKAVTLRVYAHADKESRKRASDIFRDALKEKQA